MRESFDGEIIACNRQNAGSRSNELNISGDCVRRAVGERNVPAATTLALLIVVPGRSSLARLSHGDACVGAGAQATTPMAIAQPRMLARMFSSPHHREAHRPIAVLLPFRLHADPRLVDDALLHSLEPESSGERCRDVIGEEVNVAANGERLVVGRA